jgi:hypothetical protein
VYSMSVASRQSSQPSVTFLGASQRNIRVHQDAHHNVLTRKRFNVPTSAPARRHLRLASTPAGWGHSGWVAPSRLPNSPLRRIR